MAQYVSDISGGNPLTAMAGSEDYTESLVSSPSVIGGQSLQIAVSGGVYAGKFAAVPNFAIGITSASDFEVLILARVASVSNGKISVFVQNASNFVECYVARASSSITINNGSTTTSASLGFSIADGGWYWLRFRKRTGTYYAQCWAYGASEPGAEAHSAAVAVSFTANALAWYCAFVGGSGSGTYNLDWISAGTAGDVAVRAKKTDLFVRDSGVWKPVQDLQVRDGGVWKPVQQQHVRDGGTWKKVYGS